MQIFWQYYVRMGNILMALNVKHAQIKHKLVSQVL